MSSVSVCPVCGTDLTEYTDDISDPQQMKLLFDPMTEEDREELMGEAKDYEKHIFR